MNESNSNKGFTIVELLIVIAVVAILAVTTVVAYNGIQNRANAAAIETTVGQYYRMLLQYALLNGDYPNGNSNFCLGELEDYPSGCFYSATTNETIVNKLKTVVPSLPRVDSGCKMMYSGSCRRNLTFFYQSTARLDGALHPYYIIYYIGGAQPCKLAGNVGGTWENYTSAPNATGYMERDGITKVSMCLIALPNPTKR
jgi:prepilin-type N-terminal cleavage/methylation domain-containing protein